MKRKWLSFYKNSSVLSNLKRFIGGILFQIPWFSLFSGFIWYAQTHAISFLNHYFEVEEAQKTAFLLRQKTKAIEETLSFVNPLKLADYISSLTASTFATAKVSTLEQTVHTFSFLVENVLTFMWFLGAFYVFVRAFRFYTEKTRENNIANLVIEKLIPVLEEMKNNQNIK